MSKDDVAAVLLIEFVSDFSARRDCVATGNHRQLNIRRRPQ
jgi:hypothetical protein